MTMSFLQKNIPVLTDVIDPQTPVVKSLSATEITTPAPVIVDRTTNNQIPDAAEITPPVSSSNAAELSKPTLATPATPYLVAKPTPEAETIKSDVLSPTADITETAALNTKETQEALWSQWKDEITENVMQTLLTEIDHKITQTVQTQLQDTLAVLSETIALQMKSNLESALQETVTQAIEEELQKFKS